jgi:hypothetical protein
VKVEDMGNYRLSDGSTVEAYEDPTRDEYFERKTSRDGQIHWYRIVSDGVVTV